MRDIGDQDRELLDLLGGAHGDGGCRKDVDIHGQVEFYDLIRRIRDDRNCGILLVSHDLHLVMSATDRVICLNGHVCCSGLPGDVSSDPAYLELFGEEGGEAAATVAVYAHDHDHHHA